MRPGGYGYRVSGPPHPPRVHVGNLVRRHLLLHQFRKWWGSLKIAHATVSTFLSPRISSALGNTERLSLTFLLAVTRLLLHRSTAFQKFHLSLITSCELIVFGSTLEPVDLRRAAQKLADRLFDLHFLTVTQDDLLIFMTRTRLYYLFPPLTVMFCCATRPCYLTLLTPGRSFRSRRAFWLPPLSPSPAAWRASIPSSGKAKDERYRF